MGLSQKTFGYLLHVTRDTVYSWESERRNPGPRSLMDIRRLAAERRNLLSDSEFEEIMKLGE